MYMYVCMCQVCYLVRARAMARVVLAQIEFTRAICGWQNSTYVTVIIFHDNSPLSYWNPVPIHDSYQTICTLAILLGFEPGPVVRAEKLCTMRNKC